MERSQSKDIWAAGTLYEPYVGRWSRLDAATALDPAARKLDEGRRFPICLPSPLAELFQDVGLRNVEVRNIDVTTNFRDFGDYWSPFLGGQGPAPSYTMSLNKERREALRDRIRSILPIAQNGSIPLIARAWAVRGARHTLACSPKHGI